MKRIIVAAAMLAALLTGCSGSSSDAEPATSTTDVEVTTTTSRPATTTSAPASTTAAPTTEPATTTTRALAFTYPSGDPVVAGYPLTVSVGSIDSRVQSWFEGKLNPAGQVVALAPGVYTPYSDIEPDLIAYIAGPSDGDCTVRTKFFPESGGACWDGVQPGPEEP